MNAEYIITSEFNMDKGPSILHYYPYEIPGSLNYLPEMMLPDQIHKRSEDSTIFLLHKNIKTNAFQYTYTRDCSEEPFYCYTIVNNKPNSNFKRGYVIKSLSIVTSKIFFKHFKPLLVLALDSYFYSNDLNVLQSLFDMLNKGSLSLGYELSVYKRSLISSILDLPINDKIYKDKYFRESILQSNSVKENELNLKVKNDLHFTTTINHSNFKIPIKIPMIQSSQIPDIPLKPLINKLMSCKLATPYLNEELTIYGQDTPPIIILINALLTGKKIIFIGYEHTTSQIVDFIFAAYNLINCEGLLQGYNKALYPFIDLSKIEELEKINFYLVGTANPIFKMNERLYDLIWDLDSNEFLISSNSTKNCDSKKLSKNSIISEDSKFLSYLTECLSNHHDEFTLQLICRRHLNEILRLLTQPASTTMDSTGYYWQNESIKKIELNCYKSIIKKFNLLVNERKLNYLLDLKVIHSKIGFDLQYVLQVINSPNFYHIFSVEKQKKLWLKILTFLTNCNNESELLSLVPNSNGYLNGNASDDVNNIHKKVDSHINYDQVNNSERDDDDDKRTSYGDSVIVEDSLNSNEFPAPNIDTASASTIEERNDVSTASITSQKPISSEKFDLFLLLTYLLPNESFDQNKGFEIILVNLFNNNNELKMILLKIIIELRKNFLCDWILSETNVFYQLGIVELESRFPSSS